MKIRIKANFIYALDSWLSMKTYHNFDLIYPVSLISSIAGWAVHKWYKPRGHYILKKKEKEKIE